MILMYPSNWAYSRSLFWNKAEHTLQSVNEAFTKENHGRNFSDSLSKTISNIEDV